MNRIVIELHPEDRSRLDALTEALGQMQHSSVRATAALERFVDRLLVLASESAPADAQTPAADVNPPEDPAPTETQTPVEEPAPTETQAPVEAPAPTPAEEQPPFDVESPAPVEDPAPAVEPPSLAEFQKAVAMRCVANPAIKTKVRELVSRYAASVSGIPAEKRAEVLDLLAKL